MVTRSLVSYDFNSSSSSLAAFIEWSPDHWWVTTFIINLLHLAKNWMVTRSLVSYDLCFRNKELLSLIEWSPDHWWVTTSVGYFGTAIVILNGHQIIGELRQLNILDTSLRNDWMVTRSLVSYDLVAIIGFSTPKIEWSPDHWWVTTKIKKKCKQWTYWMVTRSLVSYDDYACFEEYPRELNGHQIIGELRLHHDYQQQPNLLNGHQIIGELRLLAPLEKPIYHYWMVTRSLVSYDSSK